MTRHEELMKLLDGADKDAITLLTPLIEDVVFIEKQMEELKKLPFIVVHPKNPAKQKSTPASKQYKELAQSYINALKVIEKALGVDDTGETSPWRLYLESRVQK